MRFDRSSIFLSRIRYLVQSVLLFSFFHGGARSYEINFIRLNFYEYSFQVQLLYTQEIKKKFLNVKKLKYPLSYKLLTFFFFFLTKCRVKLKTLSTRSRDHVVMQNGKLRFNVKITGIADNILTSDSGD